MVTSAPESFCVIDEFGIEPTPRNRLMFGPEQPQNPPNHLARPDSHACHGCDDDGSSKLKPGAIPRTEPLTESGRHHSRGRMGPSNASMASRRDVSVNGF